MNSRFALGHYLRTFALLGALVSGAACQTTKASDARPTATQPQAKQAQAEGAKQAEAAAQSNAALPSAALPSATAPSAATPNMAPPKTQPPLELPPGLVIGKSVERPLSGDRDLRVAHADSSVRGAIVYLHGMCGNSKGAEPWLDRALPHGTLIVVRADQPCPDRPGYKWPKDLEAIQARIDRALAAVKEERGGLLDTEQVTLIGYSQGANRAEKLAGLQPGRYPRVVLGGTPTLSLPENLREVKALAYLGGEEEERAHMEESASLVASAGINTRFFLLPRATHGTYGPRGPQVMQEVFDFLFETERQR